MVSNNDNLISIQNLEVHYRSGGGLFSKAKNVRAVDGVSLDIKKGETLGLLANPPRTARYTPVKGENG